MRPLGALLSKEDALARLLAAARPPGRQERVALEAGAGRVVAEDVFAPFDVPPYARSTMDGYAVRGDARDAASKEESPRWRLVGEILAGSSAPPELADGEAVRIATGAPVPASASGVVRVEDTTEMDGHVTVRAAPRPGQNIERAGADLAKGDLVCRAGDVLDPPRIGLLASIGRADVAVHARPRVAIFSTGDELLQPGEPPDPYRIYDSNSLTLSTLLAAHGADVRRMPPRSDADASLDEAMRADADIILLTGGASAGAKDLVVDALRRHGDVLFHGVRVKPGKPLLAGHVGSKLVLGLPGNPTSALSNACLFVVPALRQMAGLPPSRPARTDATLASEVRGEPDRYLFLPVKLAGDTCTPTFKGSGALTSIAASDGWIGVPEGASLEAGARVRVTLW